MSATLVVERTIKHSNGVAQDFFKVALDSTYPSGGEAVDVTGDVGYFFATFDGPSVGGYVPKWDRASQKIKLFYGDNNNAADGPLIENATTDLSAEIVYGTGWRPA